MFFKTMVAGLLATSVAAAPYLIVPTSVTELKQVVPNSRIALTQAAKLINMMNLDVTADVGVMDDDTTKLTELVNAFTGKPEQLKEMATLTAKLEADIKTTTSNIANGKKIGISDAIGVGAAFQTFVPDSIASLEALVSKKEALDKAGATKEIHDSLVRQQALGVKLNAAIQAKLPSFTVSIAKQTARTVDKPLAKAISTFAQVGMPKAAPDS